MLEIFTLCSQSVMNNRDNKAKKGKWKHDPTVLINGSANYTISVRLVNLHTVTQGSNKWVTKYIIYIVDIFNIIHQTWFTIIFILLNFIFFPLFSSLIISQLQRLLSMISSPYKILLLKTQQVIHSLPSQYHRSIR